MADHGERPPRRSTPAGDRRATQLRWFDDAQRLLSALSERDSLLPGASYLTTRLLYQRGRLDLDAVVQRLRDVIEQAREFPEARTLLVAVEDRRRSPDLAPPSENSTLVDPREPESWKGSAAPAIPRAPTLPQDMGSDLSLESPMLPTLELASLSPPKRISHFATPRPRRTISAHFRVVHRPATRSRS